jgi:hypothetical protein
MVPFMGTFQLMKVRGSLKDGVRVSFDKHNLRGEARFYILDEWLWWHLSKSTVFGLSLGPLETKLIPLLCVLCHRQTGKFLSRSGAPELSEYGSEASELCLGV